jgi:hypothetical protein
MVSMVGFYKKLFVEWDLKTWAEILEIIGAISAVATFFIGRFIRSQIDRLRLNYIFDKRIRQNITLLSGSASNISTYLNNYDENREQIKTELGKCQSELEDIILKLSKRQSLKCRHLVKFIKRRKYKPFEKRDNIDPSLKNSVVKFYKRVYLTTYDDIWIVYNELLEIERQLDNFKKNMQKSI